MSLPRYVLVDPPLTSPFSITKLMGESFKLHSQALAGYEDAIMTGQQNGTPEPAMAPHAAEVAAY